MIWENYDFSPTPIIYSPMVDYSIAMVNTIVVYYYGREVWLREKNKILILSMREIWFERNIWRNNKIKISQWEKYDLRYLYERNMIWEKYSGWEKYQGTLLYSTMVDNIVIVNSIVILLW